GRVVDLMTRAGEIRERNLALNLAGGSESQRRAYLATLRGETDTTASLAALGGRPAVRLALTTLLRRKGRVLDSMADTYASLRRRPDSAAQKESARLTAVRSQLGVLVFRGRGATPLDQHLAAIARLEREADDLEAAIGTRNAAFRAASAPVTIETVQ